MTARTMSRPKGVSGHTAMVDTVTVASAAVDGAAKTSYPMAAKAEGGGDSPVKIINNCIKVYILASIFYLVCLCTTLLYSQIFW